MEKKVDWIEQLKEKKKKESVYLAVWAVLLIEIMMKLFEQP